MAELRINHGKIYVGINPNGDPYMEVVRAESTYHMVLAPHHAVELGVALVHSGIASGSVLGVREAEDRLANQQVQKTDEESTDGKAGEKR